MIIKSRFKIKKHKGIAAVFIPPLWAVVAWLGSATATMATVTFWIGAITAAISVMSGIKSIFNVHTARTAEEIYQGNNQIKKDAANTAAGVLGVVGGKSVPKPINAEKIGKFKNAVVRTWKASSGFVKGGVRKIPRLVSAAFKKDTWTGLFASFKKFSLRESDDLFGGNKKGIARKGDKVADATPNKVPAQTAPSKTFDKKLPEKQKALDVDNNSSTKTPEIETDVPVTKNLPEAKSSDLKKVDAELDAPKDKQVANGEKPPKSEMLEDNSTLKDKELDNFKKYEDDIDRSKKKKMEEDADREVSNDKNHDGKAKALVIGRMIVAANDKIDTPIPALLTELALLKTFKGVKSFKVQKSGDGFYIFLIGSLHNLTPDKKYDIDENEDKSNEESNEKLEDKSNDSKFIEEEQRLKKSTEYDELPANIKSKRLKPNTTYNKNGYSYKTDNVGRISEVSGDLNLLDKKFRNRSKYSQRTVGKGDGRLENDQGGHLIGDQFGGFGGKENLVPMHKDINNYHKGEWGQMEKRWADELDKKGTVQIKIEINYSGVDGRTSSFDITENINGIVRDFSIFNSN